MLKMLRRQMMDQKQVRFSSVIHEITTHTCKSMASSQLQLKGESRSSDAHL